MRQSLIRCACYRSPQPASERITRSLAAVLNNAGAAYAGAGQHSKAAELLAQAVEIYSSLVQKHHIDPQEPQYQQVLHNYAEALKKAHRKTEARKIEAEARNLVKGQHTIGVADSQR